VPLREALLTEAGLAHDRTFMVVDGDGVLRSQRWTPMLAVIRPAVSANGELLTLRAPGAEDLVVDVDLDAPRRDVFLAGSRYQGIDQGEPAAQWLSSVLGSSVSLVRVPPEHRRVTGGWTPGTSAYADGGAVHAISRATLSELNRRMAGAAVPMSRFRPNIVIDGWDRPRMEDRARRVRVGDAELGLAELAIRCAVTMVDQERGVKAGPEPIRTLAAYRRAPAGVVFGAKFAVLHTGKITIGDEVTVLSWSEPEF
jgi:uncharacterized protein YcbX